MNAIPLRKKVACWGCALFLLKNRVIAPSLHLVFSQLYRICSLVINCVVGLGED